MLKFNSIKFIKLKTLVLTLIALNFILSMEAFAVENPNLDFCIHPTFKVNMIEPTGEKVNDGKLSIINIYNATHYEIIEGDNVKFDFKLATPMVPGSTTIEILNVENPPISKTFNIKFYNGNEVCSTTQKIVFYHVNYDVSKDYSQVEILQAVDNSTPKIGDIATFTLIVQNKGSKKSDDIEVRLIQSQMLQFVNYFTDRGTYSAVGNVWKIGKLEGGKAIKLILRVKVLTTGLNYLSSYIAQEGTKNFSYSEAQAVGIEAIKRSATNCVSVPIAINSAEVYTISLKKYKGIKWFYKDLSGNFSEITSASNQAIAVINPDSSLTIKQGGEYSFSKKVGNCNITSCCPILVESCAGPPIVVDSVYCNTNVDSYTIIVHLENDKYNIIEKVFFSMSAFNFPVLSNYLSRINALPITASAGLVTSMGNSKFMIQNVPAFMPNVTLVSSELTGKCKNVRIVNAPNCSGKTLSIGMPVLQENIQFLVEDKLAPAFVVLNKEANTDIVWSEDEIGQKIITTGKKYRPSKSGVYYVAFRDKSTKQIGPSVKAFLKDMKAELPGKFDKENFCDCANPLMVPQGDIGNLTVATAYPNPVSDILTVDYRIPTLTKRAELIFSNINGRLIKKQELDINLHQTKIETYNWTDGMYFYSLIVDGIRTVNQKVLVSHQ